MYKYINVLSVDVALGSCLMTFLFSTLIGVNLPGIAYFTVGAVVWLVYTIDHLMDARDVGEKVVTLRHIFHKQNFQTISWVWLGVFVVGGLIALVNLPLVMIQWGLFAMLFVIIHFTLIRLLEKRIALVLQKELGVAFTYTIGVGIIPLSVANHVTFEVVMTLGGVFLIAFTNLIEFSLFDHQRDLEQGQFSISHRLGKHKIGKLIILLNIVTSLWCLIALVVSGNANFLLLLFMEGVLAMIYIQRKWFARNERFRIVGDGVFLLPVLLIPFYGFGV